nr:unnamed protein product [Callosobruchus analis]
MLVQPLPRPNINDAFYSYQISFYCLCCVSRDSGNPIFYTCTESQARQNKNSHNVHALMRFNTPIHLTEAQLIFPVRGHSFIPADRCFEPVGRLLRKHPTLISTKEYKDIYEELGEVREPGIDWRLFQVKDFLSTLKKVNGISRMKKIFLRRYENGTNVQMCCLPNYLFYIGQEKFERLLKSESVDLDLSFTELNLDRGISDKKRKSYIIKTAYGIIIRREMGGYSKTAMVQNTIK